MHGVLLGPVAESMCNLNCGISAAHCCNTISDLSQNQNRIAWYSGSGGLKVGLHVDGKSGKGSPKTSPLIIIPKIFALQCHPDRRVSRLLLAASL